MNEYKYQFISRGALLEPRGSWRVGDGRQSHGSNLAAPSDLHYLLGSDGVSPLGVDGAEASLT